MAGCRAGRGEGAPASTGTGGDRDARRQGGDSREGGAHGGGWGDILSLQEIDRFRR
jgi:hypothetical protein